MRQPPQWATGNDPEYSRADLHSLDVALAGGDAGRAAARRKRRVGLWAGTERSRTSVKFSPPG